MIRFFCDKCGKEIDKISARPIQVREQLGGDMVEITEKDLCVECAEAFGEMLQDYFTEVEQ